jgi:LPXTG-motif cell wall-anchored protein
LPETGSNPAVLAGLVAAVLGGLATVTRMGVLAYGVTKTQL